MSYLYSHPGDTDHVPRASITVATLGDRMRAGLLALLNLPHSMPNGTQHPPAAPYPLCLNPQHHKTTMQPAAAHRPLFMTAMSTTISYGRIYFLGCLWVYAKRLGCGLLCGLCVCCNCTYKVRVLLATCHMPRATWRSSTASLRELWDCVIAARVRGGLSCIGRGTDTVCAAHSTCCSRGNLLGPACCWYATVPCGTYDSGALSVP